MTVLAESFRQVFDDTNLFTLVPLAKQDDRKNKLVFEVTSTIYRRPSFFEYTKTNNGVESIAGLLFAIEVEWSFRILDRKGKVIYAPAPSRSLPASNVSIESGDDDPDWAVYSVLMDSTYYNYSRSLTGSFGLEPPVEKTAFRYQTPLR